MGSQYFDQAEAWLATGLTSGFGFEDLNEAQIVEALETRQVIRSNQSGFYEAWTKLSDAVQNVMQHLGLTGNLQVVTLHWLTSLLSCQYLL